MRKKMVNVLTCGALLCAMGTAGAAPATDYDAGKVTLEAGAVLAPDTKISFAGDKYTGDDKTRFYGGATVGLGNNIALSYQYAEAKVNNIQPLPNSYGTFKTQDINLNYKINENLYAYMGDLHAKGHAHAVATTRSGSWTTTSTADVRSSNDRFQVGVRYVSTPIDHVGFWAGIGGGEHLFRAELGGYYNITPNLDFDLSYRYMKFNKVGASDSETDLKLKGLYTGVSYHF